MAEGKPNWRSEDATLNRQMLSLYVRLNAVANHTGGKQIVQKIIQYINEMVG